MFNIGFTELLVLGVIGLLVLGPEQLPEVARKMAQIFNELKRAKDEILSPIEDLKADAHKMLEKARESAAQKELDELLHKIDPSSPPATANSERSAQQELLLDPAPQSSLNDTTKKNV